MAEEENTLVVEIEAIDYCTGDDCTGDDCTIKNEQRFYGDDFHGL